MTRQWLTWLNYLAGGIIVCLLVGAGYFWLTRQTNFSLEFAPRKSTIPKGAFARTQEEYNAIGAPAFQLNYSPLNTQLPDLRKALVYYGKNGRPDAKPENPMLFFGFTGNRPPASVHPGEVQYLAYDRSQNPPQYIFSPYNQPTPLWMIASAQGNTAHIRVSMRTQEGHVIEEPPAYADFTLPEKEYVRFGGAVWELGKFRVDGTLLARQKARWYGVDKFLERHGGKEYEAFQNRQRIDFGEGGGLYSVYVGLGECLTWYEQAGRWATMMPGSDATTHPLMCVKKVDERVMSLELWDVDGKSKVGLNLIRLNEPWQPQNLEQQFKFIGARTRSQFVFEINHERMLLSPHDWLLLRDGVWKKLKTPEEIDEYVERRAVGPLFVFDRVERKEERQVIAGTLFNAARTDAVQIELPLQQITAPTAPKKPGDEKIKKGKETNIPTVIKREEVQMKNRQDDDASNED